MSLIVLVKTEPMGEQSTLPSFRNGRTARYAWANEELLLPVGKGWSAAIRQR